MNIIDEFARLQTTLISPAEWQRVEDAWMIALNYEKRDGEWLKKEASAGDRVTGFAIDPVTKKYEIGEPGRNHNYPRILLIKRLIDERDTISYDEGERVFSGHIAQIDGWGFPFLQIHGIWELQHEELEAFILKKGLGLPIRGLLQRKLISGRKRKKAK